MVTRLLYIVLFVGILTAGCSAPPTAGISTNVPVGTPEALEPDQVAARFYDWYIGDRTSGKMRNRLADRSYHSSEYLTPELIEKVDRIVEYIRMGDYDPFFCAQDVPMSLSFGRPIVTGDRATILVRTSFVGHSFSLVLRQVDGAWRIADMVCAQTPADDTPTLDIRNHDLVR